jgi:basic membrane protein A
MRALPLVLLSATVLGVALLAGCGSDDDESAPTTTGAAETTTTAAEEPEATLRVGLITDLGQLDDDGFNELAFRGLTRAEEELGVEGRVVESASAADYIPNMSSLARQGYDLIIGVGFAQGDAIGKVAQRFPDTRFAIIDVDQEFVPGKPDNVQGLLFREEEVGYLVGYLAALQEQRRDGPDVISAVGGFKEPPVDRFIAGYRAGAQKAAPDVQVFWNYSQDWDDQAKCKELALDQIQRGSGVVFQVAGGCGLGALNAAGERGRWGIGVDADQSHLGGHILTSAQKGVDAAVFLTIQSVLDGSWAGGGNATFGLAEDGVGLGTVSPEVPEEDVEAVEEIEQQIADGEITDIPTAVGTS